MLNTFARFPDEHPALTAALYDRRENTLAFYDAVLAMIVTRDPELARDAVRCALEDIDAAWMLRNAPADAEATAPDPARSKPVSVPKNARRSRERDEVVDAKKPR